MDLSSAILACLCAITEKPPVQARPAVDRTPPRSADDVAAEIIALLRRAEKPGLALTQQIDDTAGTTGWSEWLAERVLHMLEATLEDGRNKWGEALTNAGEHALETAQEIFRELVQYVKEHPLEIAALVLLSLVALGVLARLVPVVLELLGFGMEGPVEGEVNPGALLLITLLTGSFAAWFMSTYRGYVPKRSLMAFLQRLGMTWRGKKV
ncbi:hypothetical protein B0H67DRAFT_598780 [Lasiosphaeris hirsuta]|uniref:Uncharacterized protein n=1 Tax=Lasiosphaeris hirsuta TaxID=260670 RepID=A0AA40E6A0_9PEZI|nr:hypothetical protein B0H67DRAFT_598780 [Lasiosphaeris hirsuta]